VLLHPDGRAAPGGLRDVLAVPGGGAPSGAVLRGDSSCT
jgi:hypothetical protein